MEKSISMGNSLMECPICMDMKPADEVKVLDHMEAVNGDISEHKMCLACLDQYKSKQCPFCNEIIRKEEIIKFLSEFIQTITSPGKANDHNYLASVFEMWQFFEMEFEGNVKVVRRIVGLMLKDKRFNRQLREAVRHRAGWLRDAAGIFFRIHAMHQDGELDGLLPPDCSTIASRATNNIDYGGTSTTGKNGNGLFASSNGHSTTTIDQIVDNGSITDVLEAAVEVIITPFERTPPQSFSSGHFHGALYQQAICAWLCASRTGGPTDTDVAIVRRVGHAIWHCYQQMHDPTLRKQIGERIHGEYLSLSHVPIWGSVDEDIVFVRVLKRHYGH